MDTSNAKDVIREDGLFKQESKTASNGKEEDHAGAPANSTSPATADRPTEGLEAGTVTMDVEPEKAGEEAPKETAESEDSGGQSGATGRRQEREGGSREDGGELSDTMSDEEDSGESPRKRTRQDRETARKDRSLAELLLMLDEYHPVIPDAVTDYYLARSGFECDDVRVKRLLALAAQKFVSDIAVDALQYCKIRAQGPQAKDRKGTTKDKRTVLTMDDLSAALADHGINAKKPEYYL